MTLTIVATPEPSQTSDTGTPRVRIDITSDSGDFVDGILLRDGTPIRNQPLWAGVSETFTFDYDAPLGVSTVYSVQATTIDGEITWTPVSSEPWTTPPLSSGWTMTIGGASDPIISGGRLQGSGSSMMLHKPLTRPAVSRITFDDPMIDSIPSGVGFVWAGNVFIDPESGIRTASFMSGPPVNLTPDELIGPITLEYVAGASTTTLITSAGTYQLVSGGARPNIIVKENEIWLQPGTFSIAPYTIYSGEFESESATATTTITLDEPGAWLIHSSDPTRSVLLDPGVSECLDLVIDPTTAKTTTRPDGRSVFAPAMRRESVVYPLGQRKFGEWDLVLTTQTLDARNRVGWLTLDQYPLLLRMGSAVRDYDLPDGWYSVGAITEDRLTEDLTHPGRRMTLPMLRTAQPPISVQVGSSWGDTLASGALWGDLLPYTWLDVYMGESV